MVSEDFFKVLTLKKIISYSLQILKKNISIFVWKNVSCSFPSKIHASSL